MDMNILRTKVTNAVVSRQRSADAVQDAALACLEHASEHGDVSELKRLVNGIGYGKLVLTAWIKAHSPIQTGKKDSNGDTTFTCSGWKEEGAFDLIGAVSIRWDMFGKESEPKPLNLDAVIHYLKLVANNDGKSKRVVSDEAREAARSALKAIEAVKVA